MSEIQINTREQDEYYDPKREPSYMEVGFPVVSLYGLLGYCEKHQKDPELQERFWDIYGDEYENLEQRGYIYDLWLLSDIMKYLRRERRIAIAGGNAAYSVLSYCAGITDNIDPLSYGYHPEMLFNIKWERRPYIPLVIPIDAEKDIVRYVETTYGKQNVKHDGCAYEITIHSNKEGNCYQLYLYLIRDLTLSFAERLCKFVFEGIDLQDMSDDYWKTVFAEPGCYLGTEDLADVVKDFISLSGDVDASIACNQESFISSVLDGTVSGLINAIAAIKGTHIWNETGNCAAFAGIYTTDDVYNYFVELQSDKEVAFSIMEDVRKGKVQRIRERFGHQLSKHPVKADNFLKACGDVRYLVSRGSVLPYAQLFSFLTYCRRNVDQYQAIYEEMLEKKE